MWAFPSHWPTRLISAIHHKWLDLLIARTTSDPNFRIQALHFIDVLPNLNNDQSLTEHLQGYLLT
jgi:Proline utilization A N-terminal domain